MLLKTCFHVVGAPLLLLNKLAHNMERPRTHQNRITGIARQIQGHRNINDIAHHVVYVFFFVMKRPEFLLLSFHF